MIDDEKKLIEKFKKIEGELVELLKLEEIDFSDEAKRQTVKSKIKANIKKVEKAKKLFQEYEAVANLIEEINHSGEAEHAAEIVDLRKDDVDKKVEFVDKVIVEGGKVKTTKIKKTTKSREF